MGHEPSIAHNTVKASNNITWPFMVGVGVCCGTGMVGGKSARLLHLASRGYASLGLWCRAGGTMRRFPLTPLAYVFILIHCIILMVGGHYTYAEVPLFNWFRDVFDMQRNNYDKIGHSAQGFVPAIIAREIFIKKMQRPGVA